jgi:mRNA deadenylase 3'-5' endonuclease subunit Ccr4
MNRLATRLPTKKRLEDIISPYSSLSDKLNHVCKEYPPLYDRHWMTYCGPSDSAKTFTVMQFNLLAEGLSSHPSNTPIFDDGLNGSPIDQSDCGGFDTDETAAILFDFENYRKWRLVEEILRIAPDFIALEECDHYDDFFYPILHSLGYEVR